MADEKEQPKVEKVAEQNSPEAAQTKPTEPKVDAVQPEKKCEDCKECGCKDCVCNKKAAGTSGRVRLLQVLFVGLLVAALGFGGGWLGGRRNSSVAVTPAQSHQQVVLNDQGDLISSIAENVGKSVVSVEVTSTASSNSFWGPSSYQQQSAGTGIILNTEGLIITNRHVVPDGTTGVSVVLSNGKKFSADVVGRTTSTDPLDVAFLKIKNLGDTKLTPAKLGNSADMKVGFTVVAIGNALGQFQNTVTMGILSGYGRSLVAGDGSSANTESLQDMFQTDAAINQGNSGGPLVNVDGEVIGINTAVADSAENIGFAIPIDNVKGLIENVEKTGKLERPYLGVVYVMLTPEIAKEYNLDTDTGAYIIPSDKYGQTTIVAGSPAAEAGLQEGDIIVKVNDTEINDKTTLASVLGRYTPGQTVKLTVNRGGETKTVDVTLGTMPNSN